MNRVDRVRARSSVQVRETNADVRDSKYGAEIAVCRLCLKRLKLNGGCEKNSYWV